ncbi:MAG: hypothetical protein LBD75_02360 [Candidatus Peribacteria bacterium]|jgi:hypothetical protein|nr:hypothetical protein [Candidatus Peribacteria bacterium]
MSAYENAKMALGIQYSDTKELDQQLIKNLFSLILVQKNKLYKTEDDFNKFLKDNGLSIDTNGDIQLPTSVQNFDGVLKFFKEQPALLDILKQSVNASHEYLTQAFTYGATYAQHHLQREKDVKDEKEADTGKTNSNAAADAQQLGQDVNTSDEWNREVEKQMSEKYEIFLQTLLRDQETQKTKLKEQIKNENDSIKKADLEAQLKALDSPELQESMKLLGTKEHKEKILK